MPAGRATPRGAAVTVATVASCSANGPSSTGSARYSSWALALAGISCFLFCVNGELLQALQLLTPASEGHASPLLNLALCHMGGLLLIPFLVSEGKLGSCSSSSSTGSHDEISRSFLAGSSFFFACLMMGYNYAWLRSATNIAVGLTNAVFQVSAAFVCAASAVLFREPVSAKRVLGVALAIVGSATAAHASMADQETMPHLEVERGSSPLALPSDARGASLVATTPALGKTSVGVSLALVAAVGVTIYQVSFRIWFAKQKSNKYFLANFFVCISAWHVVFLPLLYLADAWGFEELQVPHGYMAIAGTAVSALIASSVNMMYFCIVLWGSPMLLPSASALSVPLIVLFDVLLHHARPGVLELLGHGMVVAAVGLITQVQYAPDTRMLLGKAKMDCMDV